MFFFFLEIDNLQNMTVPSIVRRAMKQKQNGKNVYKNTRVEKWAIQAMRYRTNSMYWDR